MTERDQTNGDLSGKGLSHSLGNGQIRWIVLGVLVSLGGGFIGAYNFFASQFATKAEVAIIRDEQQRRTKMVYSVPDAVDDLKRSVELQRLDIRRLELAVSELRMSVLQARGGR